MHFSSQILLQLSQPQLACEAALWVYGRFSVEQKLEKLTRADIEWLLATHQNGRGPVDWSVAGQKEREGLDLCGADLQGIDLSDLPLSCLRGGLTSLYKKAFAG